MIKTMTELLELKKKALICMGKHKQALGGVWEHGEPDQAWYDADNVFCVKYQDGTWWHYGNNGEWW